MSIWIKLYVLSNFSPDIIALNIYFNEKKNSFEPIDFQLTKYKISQIFTEAYNYQQT